MWSFRFLTDPLFFLPVGCRNTVFNAAASTAAAALPRLLAAGVTRLRIEFVRETEKEVRTSQRSPFCHSDAQL